MTVGDVVKKYHELVKGHPVVEADSEKVKWIVPPGGKKEKIDSIYKRGYYWVADTPDGKIIAQGSNKAEVLKQIKQLQKDGLVESKTYTSGKELMNAFMKGEISIEELKNQADNMGTKIATSSELDGFLKNKFMQDVMAAEYNIPEAQLVKKVKELKKGLNESILNENEMPLYKIAQIISQDWQKVSPYAKPYLDAMRSLKTIDDRYILDSGYEIVARFLANAGTWRGPVAKNIKAILNKMLKS